MKVIEKNSREVIVVQESEYKDNTFVDIRVHGKNDNDDLTFGSLSSLIFSL